MAQSQYFKEKKVAQKNKPATEKRVETGMEPDWEHKCEVCGERPIVPATGMCGPCTFGEAETFGGNW
jgi:hypothetical protein